ncbi:fimbria/pilus outer membrane usher protein [Methylovorus sp. MM2]|uniref:fimbria/pilus outer membrane usher protein n=1 Tax=Methylovorus sp. MM2 TaxID=1848038 RepID=UPI00104271CB|nr:fimbria/pilus outer membrane usher protein [Methylovorus sp. MM2]
MRNWYWSDLSYFLVLMSLCSNFSYGTEVADYDQSGLPRPQLHMTKSLFQELAYEAKVNEQADQETVVFLRTSSGYLLASEAFLQRSRMVLPPESDVIEYYGERFVPINQLPKVDVSINEKNSEIAITAPPDIFVPIEIEGRKLTKSVAVKENGAFFNYDLFAQKFDSASQYDGRFELGIFNHYGVGQMNILARDFSNQKELIRLETNWTVDRPDEMASWRLGDGINSGGSIGRPIRFGGIQYSTNFATQPDFVAFPQYSLRGSAALPSTVDLYINNVRSFSQEVAPGPFTINNLPVLTGSGEARLVVRDMFGREQLISQPYYASRTLLKKGLSDYSYEGGFERFNYGFVSDDYRDIFASGTHRYGVSEKLTVEGHAEVKAKQQTGSISNVLLLPKLGVLDGTLAFSNSSGNERGGGHLQSVGFERQSAGWSYGLRTQIASQDFRQLGLPEGISAPARLSTVFLAWHQANFGSVSMNYIDQKNRELENARLLSINYSRTIFGDWFLNVNAFKNLESQEGYTVGFNIIKALDNRTSGSMFNTYSRQFQENSLQVQRALPAGNGVGYRALVSDGTYPRQEAGVSVQNDIGTYSVDASHRNDMDAYRMTASGGVAYAGGHAVLTRRIGNGFAMVDVGGYPNVKVFAENQLIGMTDKNGMQIIPNLRAYQRNRITIDPTDIPFEVQVDAVVMEAVPYYRSASYLRFPIRKEKSATLHIRQRNGLPVPSGAVFKSAKDDATGFPVADLGFLFLKYLDKKNHFIGKWQDNVCEFDLDYPETQDPIPYLGEVFCK